MAMIEVRGLRRSYGGVQALKGLSFEVESGEIFGIIGPDGAGKTTLFRILTTLLLADSGVATVGGLDVARDFMAIRSRVGYMPGRFSLYQDLSVEENLRFFATVFGTTIEENYELVADIYSRLEPFKHRKAGALSGGMKQKLALCCALIHEPETLFLDEPTTGVDPVSRAEFWEMLARLKARGITILVSTPYMDEAGLCDRIALIQDGVFLGIDAPAGIVARYDKELFAVRGRRMSALLADIRAHEKVLSCYAFGESHHVAAERGALDPGELGRYLTGKGHEGVEVGRAAPSVEDFFMDMAARAPIASREPAEARSRKGGR
jgi:ABC-type multidrug transport system ATPase subunit